MLPSLAQVTSFLFLNSPFTMIFVYLVLSLIVCVCSTCPSSTFADCPVGEFSPSAGSSHCLVCSSGQHQSNTLQSSCSNCVAGTYSPTSDQKDCLPCPAGAFSNVTGRSFCFSCPKGLKTLDCLVSNYVIFYRIRATVVRQDLVFRMQRGLNLCSYRPACLCPLHIR